MHLVPIFPRVIGLSNLKYNLNQDELNYILDLKKDKRNNVGNYTSSPSNVLEAPVLVGLKIHILNELHSYMRTVYRPRVEDLELVVTQSWVNFSEKNEYHHKHSHFNSVISGVYYVEADEGNNSIDFFDPLRPREIEIDTSEYTSFNSAQWTISIEKSQAIFFPSYLEHCVSPNDNKDDKTRVSIAYNSFFAPGSNPGNLDRLTSLSVNPA